MEIKLVIDDRLIARVAGFAKNKGAWASVALLLSSLPVVLQADMEPPVFVAGTAISASEINAAFEEVTNGLNDIFYGDTEKEGDLYVHGNVGIGTSYPEGMLDLQGDPSTPLSGLVTVAANSTELLGSGTYFEDELAVGDAIQIGSEVFAVAAIYGQETLELSQPSAVEVSWSTAFMDGSLLVLRNGAGDQKMVVDKSGNLGIGTSEPGARLEVNGDARFGCRTGFWTVADGRICVEQLLRGPSDAWAAIGTCRDIAPGCRVCTHNDLQQACGAGVANPYGADRGWYGDHGTTVEGVWDDTYGTWNRNYCTNNNDDAPVGPYQLSLNFRCCY